MRVLVACEYSGRVRDAFTKLGHDAISCDLSPSESPGEHIQGDIFHYLQNNYHRFELMIAHPPCTYLCNSGSTWLWENRKKEIKNKKRWRDMRDGAHFFKQLLEYSIPKICIENPIMHGHAKKIIGRGQDQLIQPWQYGHGETKATCLWLKGLPKLIPTNIVEGREQRLHRLPPGPDRAKQRSLTYQGIADAMAEQWG